jgi:hypothetical protein
LSNRLLEAQFSAGLISEKKYLSMLSKKSKADFDRLDYLISKDSSLTDLERAAFMNKVRMEDA